MHSRCTAEDTYSMSLPKPVNLAFCRSSSIKSTSVVTLKQYSPNRGKRDDLVGGGGQFSAACVTTRMAFAVFTFILGDIAGIFLTPNDKKTDDV
jgi:hypothetical protein